MIAGLQEQCARPEALESEAEVFTGQEGNREAPFCVARLHRGYWYWTNASGLPGALSRDQSSGQACLTS